MTHTMTDSLLHLEQILMAMVIIGIFWIECAGNVVEGLKGIRGVYWLYIETYQGVDW